MPPLARKLKRAAEFLLRASAWHICIDGLGETDHDMVLLITSAMAQLQ
jgi:hypothetical protein